MRHPRFSSAFAVIALLALAVPVLGFAQDVPPPDPGAVILELPVDLPPIVGPEEDLLGFAGLVINAIQSRNYFLLASLAVIGLVWAARKFLGAKVPFFRTDLGGVSLSLLMSLGATLGAAFLAGTPFGWPLLIQALGVALGASGALVYVKKLLGISSGGVGGASAGGQPAAPPKPDEPMPSLYVPNDALGAQLSKADVSRQRGVASLGLTVATFAGVSFLLACVSFPVFVRGYQAQEVRAVFQAPLNDSDIYACTAITEKGERFLLCDELSRTVERSRERSTQPAPVAAPSSTSQEI